MGYVEHINCGFSQELVTCRVFLGEKESVSIFRIFLLVMIRCHREEDPSRFFFFFLELYVAIRTLKNQAGERRLGVSVFRM